jgi:hypothetical protein
MGNVTVVAKMMPQLPRTTIHRRDISPDDQFGSSLDITTGIHGQIYQTRLRSKSRESIAA